MRLRSNQLPIGIFDEEKRANVSERPASLLHSLSTTQIGVFDEEKGKAARRGGTGEHHMWQPLLPRGTSLCMFMVQWLVKGTAF